MICFRFLFACLLYEVHGLRIHEEVRKAPAKLRIKFRNSYIIK